MLSDCDYKFIVITGSRTWTDERLVRYWIKLATDKLYTRGDTPAIVHGAARGADSIADKISEELGIQRFLVPPNWVVFGKPAGMIRNRLMLKMFDPIGAIAFRAYGSSPGTDGMIAECEERSIPIKIVCPE